MRLHKVLNTFCAGLLGILILLSTASATLRYAYTVNSDDNTISIFSVNPTSGQLRATGYALTGAFPRATAIALGKYLYVTNVNANNVYGYRITNATGALRRLSGGFATGAQPWSILVHPSGKFLYVANSSSNSISAFAINATTGALTRFATYGSGTMPRSLALNPTGKFLYVGNYGHHRNPDTGLGFALHFGYAAARCAR
jgi:6-phosphogluconolactonase